VVPGGIKILVAAGHTVLVQKNAGLGAGILDEMYKQAGATVLNSAKEVWDKAQLIVKVKEPIAEEYDLIKERHILYTFLHLAAEPELTKVLIKSGCLAIAYETIELTDRSLPLLRPMSEVAGRMSVQVGACCLQKHWGGKGLLLGGVPGVRRGRVCIIGGGQVGTLPLLTPGTPPNNKPLPPQCFCKQQAPTCTDIRPATSLIGRKRGKDLSVSSMVSYAIAKQPDFINTFVNSGSAARCKNV
jgi:hypothetical protein